MVTSNWTLSCGTNSRLDEMSGKLDGMQHTLQGILKEVKKLYP